MASLKWYVLRRILTSVPIIIVIASLGFMIIHLAPGDPITYLVGETATSPEYIAMMRAHLGLDRPLVEQYWNYLVRLCRFDLGYSLVYNKPVLYLILERLPLTALLVFSSSAVFFLIAVFLGVLVSTRPHSLVDKCITTLALFGYSMPQFWLGIVLMYIFGLQLRWFPLFGVTTLGAELTGLSYVLDILYHLVLPASVFGMYCLAVGIRVTRISMIETLQENFIITARSKGLDEKTVIFKHALRNSLRSTVTLITMSFGWVLAGSVLIETVFAWPGLGLLMYLAIQSRDYPLILGLFILSSIAMIVANLVADIFYTVLDPRIKYK